jgi:hypothetical protein
MGAHLVNGEFVSDKFPGTPAGYILLSFKSPRCQDLLWELAERSRPEDEEFADDVQNALRVAGFKPGQSTIGDVTVGEIASGVANAALDLGTRGKGLFDRVVKAGGDWVGRGGTPPKK